MFFCPRISTRIKFRFEQNFLCVVGKPLSVLLPRSQGLFQSTSSLPSCLSEPKKLRPWSRSRQARRYKGPGRGPPQFARRGALGMILAHEGACWTFSRPCFAPVPDGGARKQHRGRNTFRWIAEHRAQHRNATNWSTNEGAKQATGLLSWNKP